MIDGKRMNKLFVMKEQGKTKSRRIFAEKGIETEMSFVSLFLHYLGTSCCF